MLPILLRRPARWLALLLATLATTWASLAGAAATDIATAPLFTSSNTQVKPNIMFILDDSGSMAWDYLPDVSNFSSTKYGKKAHQCNGVAYNPTVTYSPPLNANGTAQANASLSVITSLSDPIAQTTNQRFLAGGTLAMPTTLTGTITVTVNGSSMTSSTYAPEQTVTIFQALDSNRFFTGEVVSWNRTSSSVGTLVIDISGGFMEGTGSFSTPVIGRGVPKSPTYYRYTGTQRPLSYTYTGSGVVTSSTFYQECNSAVGSTPGSNVFTAVSVTASSPEAQNYANWSTYYSTRILMMKSSVSRAFASLDNRYRVGYTTINERTAADGNDFLNIGDFDATQKGTFYSRMFGADTGNSTPLRGALSKAGQYYANKARGQTVDPVQYSCQRNYAILSTDGYWNTGSESTSTPKYGPYRLDNTTAVGQQDGSGTARPMNDGNTVTKTTSETWTVTVAVRSTDVTPQTATSTVTRTTTTVAPIRGETNFTFDLLTKQTVDGSLFQRPPNNCAPNCDVVVTLAAHKLLAGDSVTISSASNGVAAYLGTFAITRIDADHFSYRLSSRPGDPIGSGNGNNGNGNGNGNGSGSAQYFVSIAGSATCTAGNGKVARRWSENRDQRDSNTASQVDSTFVTSTRTAVYTSTTTTPYTTTTVETDGVAGTPVTTTGSTSTSTLR